MTQKSTVKPEQEAVAVPVATQAAVAATQPAAAVAVPAEPKPTPAKAAVKKAATKAKPVKKADAAPAEKKESAAKPVPAEKAPAKAAKKAAAESKVVAPKVEKLAKVKKQPVKKPKLVRDSFTMPESDYALFASLKQRALAAGADVKKAELLRAGLALLAKLNDAELVKAIGLVERIKTGRPKK
jgi:hypothetical protein